LVLKDELDLEVFELVEGDFGDLILYIFCILAVLFNTLLKEKASLLLLGEVIKERLLLSLERAYSY